MAKIIENQMGRRLIKISVNDIISIVREYQRIVKHPKNYERTREVLSETCIYIPEEL